MDQKRFLDVTLENEASAFGAFYEKVFDFLLELFEIVV
jgi:hypothetical protein